MRDAVTVRLPPSLLVKLERRAARVERSRDTYIASILKRALEDGHPIIIEADQSSEDIDARPCEEAGAKKIT
jgi:predicted transcriptional regulator